MLNFIRIFNKVRVDINKLISVILIAFLLIINANTAIAKNKEIKAKATIFDVVSDKLEYVPEKEYFEATGDAKIIIK